MITLTLAYLNMYIIYIYVNINNVKSVQETLRKIDLN